MNQQSDHRHAPSLRRAWTAQACENSMRLYCHGLCCPQERQAGTSYRGSPYRRGAADGIHDRHRRFLQKARRPTARLQCSRSVDRRQWLPDRRPAARTILRLCSARGLDCRSPVPGGESLNRRKKAAKRSSLRRLPHKLRHASAQSQNKFSRTSLRDCHPRLSQTVPLKSSPPYSACPKTTFRN